MQKVKMFKSHTLGFLETDINSWSANTSITILNTSITCDTRDYYICVVTYSI